MIVVFQTDKSGKMVFQTDNQGSDSSFKRISQGR